jgi:haloacid dehalogenase superfamily, subfamily IA, variant 3 with third motif having DD or ED/haloacid dehalogenase superfamily, subfamily IA, variant 1 with third motif having Dx(3-4)D or Dx(3-4)E
MEAAIFDLDGVLINSEPLHFSAAITLLRRLNIETTEEYHNQYVGSSDPVKWGKIIKEFNIQNSLQEILNMSVLTKLELLRQSDSYTPIEGIPELLKALKAHNIPIAVASSSTACFIKEVLNKVKIEKYIKTWVSGDDIEKSKPEPDIFLKTAELLQVNPRKCIVVEDSKNGVIAAKKAGMKCIGFKNINSGNQDLSRADVIVDNIQDINIYNLLSMEY